MHWRKREWDSLSQDEILIKIAVITIIASLALAFISTFFEVASFYRQRVPKLASVQQKTKKETELKPTVHPLRMLPPEIDKFTTTARQMMPGAEKYAAEAIYEPKDEDLSPAAPLNTYVKIVYHASKQTVLKSLRNTLNRRYPKDHKTQELFEHPVYSGYQADYGSYYLGWAWNRYSIEIDTSYTSEIPADKGSLLSDVTLQIAEVVDASVRQATR